MRHMVWAEIELDDFTDEELLEELRLRHRREVNDYEKHDDDRLLQEAYDAASRGDLSLTTLRLRQYLFPKWKEISVCRSEFDKAKAA